MAIERCALKRLAMLVDEFEGGNLAQDRQGFFEVAADQQKRDGQQVAHQ